MLKTATITHCVDPSRPYTSLHNLQKKEYNLNTQICTTFYHSYWIKTVGVMNDVTQVQVYLIYALTDVTLDIYRLVLISVLQIKLSRKPRNS